MYCVGIMSSLSLQGGGIGGGGMLVSYCALHKSRVSGVTAVFQVPIYILVGNFTPKEAVRGSLRNQGFAHGMFLGAALQHHHPRGLHREHFFQLPEGYNTLML